MSDILRKATVGAIGVCMAAALSVTAPAGAGTVPESTDPIKIAINEWTGQHITAHVAGEVLKRMGYNVEYVTAGYYPQLAAMEDNSVTAALEIWSSNIGEHYDKALASGKVEEIGDLGLVPVETWMYPAYVEEMCPGLPNWEALNSCADIFATAETLPKGRFLDYPADWGTSNVDRIAALGLNFVSVPAGSEGALVAEVKSAVSRKEPLLMMFWKPHWLHANYDMKVLALPPYAEGCYDDPSWGLNAGATYDCDWERGYIKKMIWSGMKDKWPAAYRLLQNYTLTNEDQNPMMKAIDVDGRDLVEVVSEWIEANEARWMPWVKDALM